MRRRLPVAAATAALAATLLTACHSNVGAAASVNGHRIKESDVTKYLTANARDLVAQDASGQQTSTPARTFVLNTLIRQSLFQDVLKATPKGAPTPSEISDAEQSYLQSLGGTADQLTQSVQRSGFTKSFAALYLRENAFENILSTELSAGVPIDKIIQNTHAKVSVNPRYGSWNAKTFVVSTEGNAGLPSFLHANATYTPPAPASSSAQPGTS